MIVRDIAIDGTVTEHEVPGDAAPLSWDALDFKRRFTQAERIAILTAAKSSAEVQDFVALLDTAAACGRLIYANDVDVISGLNAYEQAGLIGPGRASAILTS